MTPDNAPAWNLGSPQLTPRLCSWLGGLQKRGPLPQPACAPDDDDDDSAPAWNRAQPRSLLLLLLSRHLQGT